MPFKSTIHNPQFTICIEVIEMDAIETLPTQQLDPFKGVKKVPLEEYFTSGHRTCQGCESALVMKLMVKAAGPRTIVLGSTGCMYVANTTYYSTSWVVPWMHTQLGSSEAADAHALEEEHGGDAGGRPPRDQVRGHRLRIVRRGYDEPGAQGADDRRADVRALAGSLPERVGLRSDAVPRTGRAGGGDRDLAAVRGRKPCVETLRPHQGHCREAL